MDPLWARQEGAQHDAFRALVRRWAGHARRDLPWRRTRDPWAILVAEVMLQQTQVARVIPKWHRFLERFPSVAHCAEADQAEIVRLWEGLGYHRRAVYLHRCALSVVANHDSQVPDDFDALIALPGIGRYTAHAIRVFAYERNDAVVDTNVGRVVARAVSGRALSLNDAQAICDALVPPGDSWAWNQAMLDFGALVCTKRKPTCDTCPVQAACRWFRSGQPSPDPADGSGGVSTPQSTFRGSDREARGRILGMLRAADAPLKRSVLAEGAGLVEGDRFKRILESLCVDGLVSRRGPAFVLA